LKAHSGCPKHREGANHQVLLSGSEGMTVFRRGYKLVDSHYVITDHFVIRQCTIGVDSAAGVPVHGLHWPVCCAWNCGKGYKTVDHVVEAIWSRFRKISV